MLRNEKSSTHHRFRFLRPSFVTSAAHFPMSRLADVRHYLRFHPVLKDAGAEKVQWLRLSNVERSFEFIKNNGQVERRLGI